MRRISPLAILTTLAVVAAPLVAATEVPSDPAAPEVITAAASPDPAGPVVITEPAPEDPLERVGIRALRIAAGLPVLNASGEPVIVQAQEPVPGLSEHVEPSCTGTGADGRRVQVMYVREKSQPDRYAQVKPVLLEELRDIDDIFAVSSESSGDSRRVRWVHTNCAPSVLNVVVPDGALTTSFESSTAALRTLGYTRTDRKYLAFTDTSEGLGYACGVAELFGDSSATANANDGAYSQIARVNTNCWVRTTRSTAAHELIHSLGAVLPDAPNGSAAGHCDDAADVMCYDDGTTGPMRSVCPAEHATLLDCGRDDYFSTAPAAGSRLDTYWNVADSSFLDRVGPLAAPPTVTVATNRSTAQTGDLVTVTAAASEPATFTWSTTGCTLGATSGAKTTLRCPWYEWGTQTVTVRATTATGRVGTGSVKVQVDRAPTLSGYITHTGQPQAGRPFTFEARVTSGKAPFTYAWTGLPPACPVTGSRSGPTLTLTCPASIVGQRIAVNARVDSLDEDYFTGGTIVTVGPAARTAVVPRLTVSGAYRPRATLTARITEKPTGRAVMGRPVSIQARWLGTRRWFTVARKTTFSTGAVTVVRPTGRAAHYRLVFSGDSRYLPATSGPVLVKVPTRVTSRGGRTTVVTGRATNAAGDAIPRARVVLQRSVGRRWVRAGAATANFRGVLRARVPRTTANYRWLLPATWHLHGAVSPVARIIR